MIVTTKSGTKYKIDLEAKTWKRLSKTEQSGELRSEGGVYWDLEPVVVGLGLRIICPPLTEGNTYRLVWTSDVVSVEEE